MKKITLFFFGMTLSMGLIAQTPVPAGDVSGTWTASGSPYLIQGDIQIQPGTTLTIEPGVTVEFQGNYGLDVYGNILAVGTPTDSIIFIPSNPTVGFNPIVFDGPPPTNDSSLFVYCSFKHAINTHPFWPYNCGGVIGVRFFSKIRIDHCYFGFNTAIHPAPNGYPSGGAIAMEESDILIFNSTFEENSSEYGGAIAVYWDSNPIIKNCRFINNSAIVMGGGIAVMDASSPLISGNEFIGNSVVEYGGGICVTPFNNPTAYSNPTIERNLFYNNVAGTTGGAIDINAPTEMTVTNNTIVYNRSPYGGGINIYGEANPVIENTILWGNTANAGNQVYIFTEFAFPAFLFSDIEGGDTAFGGATFSGDYLFNINADPIICDTGTQNFHLHELSPCIDSGDTSCVASNGTRCDIGAFEGDYCPAVGIPIVLTDPQAIHIYPVPASDKCHIEFSLPEAGNVRLEIVDLSGRLVQVVIDSYMQVGDHKEVVHVSSWKSGIYICRLQTNGQLAVVRLIKY